MYTASDVPLLGKWYAAADVRSGPSCSVTPAELAGLANGGYKWRIQDYGAYGNGVMTGLQEFVLNR